MKLGWISPDGDFIECHSYDHIATATELCKKFGYKADILERVPDDTLLMRHGWAYVGISELDHNYRVGWSKFLTEPQKNVLKEYLESDRLDKYCRERLLMEYD